ncbi:hypothetical protein BaRGS_00018583 [Batillaria attramentaria]|uniref:Globin n=1 Tax=Batillaria attramentaria TaxID=370345 RepID=A0ABD0KSJ7_9CAEN
MGCAKSTPKGEASVNPPRDALEILTDGQKDLLRTSWEAFRTEYVLTDGIQIYIHLFTVDPSAATLFSFVEEVSIEHLLTNEQLFGHVWSLLEYLDMAITHLDDLHYLRREAFDLGVRHSIYGVRNEQFQVSR